MELIFHIAERKAWELAQAAGQYVAESLANEGFIHCSTRAQVLETANRYYRGRSGLLLLCIDPAKLSSELTYEPAAVPAGSDAVIAPRTEWFPHVYGPLQIDAIIDSFELQPDATGEHAWPPALDPSGEYKRS